MPGSDSLYLLLSLRFASDNEKLMLMTGFIGVDERRRKDMKEYIQNQPHISNVIRFAVVKSLLQSLYVISSHY